MHLQTIVKWQGTTAWSRFVYTCKGTTIQICHGCQLKIYGTHHTQSLKYTVLVEAQDKLRHQGLTCTYCLIKWQYYWKGMNKDICKYIANCTLCQREKAKVQSYPLQMTEIPDRPFNKITIDLVIECKTSTSGNRHILTIIYHLTGWPEAFSILDKSTDTIVSTLSTTTYQYKCALDTFYQTMALNLRISQWTKFSSNSYLLCTIPPPEQWKIGSISQISKTYTQENVKKIQLIGINT